MKYSVRLTGVLRDYIIYLKPSEHFALNKCSVLVSEMFSMFEWGFRRLHYLSEKTEENAGGVGLWSKSQLMNKELNLFGPGGI